MIARSLPATVALLVYAGVFWVLILLPFDFHAPRLPDREAAAPDPEAEEEEPRNPAVSALKTLGHAVLFLPLGPLLAWWAGLPPRRLFGPRIAVPAVLLAGASEISQLTVSRGTSWGDFAMDVLGYAAGAALAASYPGRRGVRSLALAAASPRIALAGLAALSAAAFVLLLPARGLLFGPRDLEGWDPSYPFLAGNEATGSRPWRGEIESFAIHDRALEPAALAGPALPAPLVSYRFGPESLRLGAGGAVEEVRPEAGPVLRAAEGAAILTVPGGGVSFGGGTSSLAGKDPPAVEALKRSGEVSIRARFRTADIRQRGPARIVSCSVSQVRRNFTLGQRLDGLELRVRTPLTGPNGSLQTLRTGACLVPGRWVDVVATYRRGILGIHVDGVPGGRLRLCFLGWLVAIAFGTGLSPSVASGIAYVFWAAAFGLLWTALERLGCRRSRSIILAALGAALLSLVLALAASVA